MQIKCKSCDRHSVVDSDAKFCQICGNAYGEYAVTIDGSQDSRSIKELAWDETTVWMQMNRLKTRIGWPLFIVFIVSSVLKSQPTPVQYSDAVWGVSLGILIILFWLPGFDIIKMLVCKSKIRKIGISPDVCYDKLV